MAKINLRDFYPWYTWDEFVEVPDVIAGELFADRRYQQTHERTIRRNKVYSLDIDDGTEELASSRLSDNPALLLDVLERHCGLCCAINSLPEIQGRRVEAKYFLGRTQKEIANKEGVSEEAVSKSIEKALRAMKKYFSTEG